DRIALKTSRARPVDEREAPDLYADVRDLSQRAGLPMPRLYLIPSEQPNAFATGRSHTKAALAVTEGLLRHLPREQVRGVLADALTTLERGVQAVPMHVNPAVASLYIANPLSGHGMAALFSTHPPMAARIERLRVLDARNGIHY